MKYRITKIILAVLPLITAVGCGKKSDNSALQTQMMMSQAQAQAQASSNQKCSASAACVAQCQKNYATNPSFMQQCMSNSTTGVQGKLNPDGSFSASTDFIESCDDKGVCVYTPTDGLKD